MRPARILLFAAVISLLAVACSSNDATSTETTTAADPTSEPAVSTNPAPTAAPSSTPLAKPTSIVIDELFLASQLEESAQPDLPGAVMVVAHDHEGARAWAGSGTDPSGAQPTPDAPIRIGSITKTFSAVVVLSLVADGLIDLDDDAVDHLDRVDLDPRITIRDLLQHSSGLPDSTEVPRFNGILKDDPTRSWAPEDILALTSTIDVEFEPGSKSSYSNNNYTVLGVLIEEVTGQPFHEALRARVLDPLGLDGTYLPVAEDGPEPFGGYEGATFGGTTVTEPITFDFTSYTTASWAAGGLVSTAPDLHTFISALFEGAIIPPSLVTEMTANPANGFGIYAPEWDSPTPVLGHDGRTAGAGTFLLHAPETGMTVFTMSNANYLFVSPATKGVAIAIGNPNTTLVPN